MLDKISKLISKDALEKLIPTKLKKFLPSKPEAELFFKDDPDFVLLKHALESKGELS
jgi:hypothetical protein